MSPSSQPPEQVPHSSELPLERPAGQVDGGWSPRMPSISHRHGRTSTALQGVGRRVTTAPVTAIRVGLGDWPCLCFPVRIRRARPASSRCMLIRVASKREISAEANEKKARNRREQQASNERIRRMLGGWSSAAPCRAVGSGPTVRECRAQPQAPTAPTNVH